MLLLVFYDANGNHFDTLAIRQFLALDELDELHHLTMRLDLCHILLDGQLLAFKEAILLALVHVERGKCVDEKVGLAVVEVALDQDVGHC